MTGFTGFTVLTAPIWRNPDRVPVLYRPPAGRLLARLPVPGDNLDWVLGKNLRWAPDLGVWELPRARFTAVAYRLLVRYEQAWLIQAFARFTYCGASCTYDKGLDCQCACEGRSHGLARGEITTRQVESTAAVGMKWVARWIETAEWREERLRALAEEAAAAAADEDAAEEEEEEEDDRDPEEEEEGEEEEEEEED